MQRMVRAFFIIAKLITQNDYYCNKIILIKKNKRMKRIILVLIAIFSLNMVAYASFPVVESPVEQLLILNEIPPVSSGGTGWGIAALCCGILGLVLWPFPLLGTLAIIFGAIGLNKRRGRGMAMAGLILGIIKVIFYFLLILAFLPDFLEGAALGAAFGGWFISVLSVKLDTSTT